MKNSAESVSQPNDLAIPLHQFTSHDMEQAGERGKLGS
jgi:hypothetical protein